MAPRKLWKTEITIWTNYNPTKVPVSRLAQEGESGAGYIARAHSELISSPCMQDDGPPEDFFDDDATN
jgi:hypothetical protein